MERDASRSTAVPCREAGPGIDDEDRRTLRQLDDTRYLAVGHLDDKRCERLATRGLVVGDEDGYWRITALGRRALDPER